MIDAFVLSAFVLPLASYHFERNGQNEINPGVIAEFRLENAPEWGLITGGYENSHSKTTVFASVVRHLGSAGPVDFSASLGVGTGYNVPVVGGFHVTVWERLSLTIVPPVSSNSGVVAVAFRIPVL